MPTETLSADQARTSALHAQGLLDVGALGTAQEVLRQLGAVQLDTIAVLARSHELVPYARLGPIGRAAVEKAFWDTTPVATFEYWAHALCVLPIGTWPYFAFRRRAEQLKRRAKPRVGLEVLEKVRAMLRKGPVTSTELGGSRASGGWSSPSEAKAAAETLYWTGEASCVTRDRFRRVYHLTEDVIPADLLDMEPSDRECHRYLARRAVTAMGLATRKDIAEYFRLKQVDVAAALATSPELLEVRVEGWPQPAWTTSEGLLAARSADPEKSRTCLLSPFDPLVWNRERALRIFGVAVELEAYKPQSQRVNGYFAMPVLDGGRLIGSLDPAREEGVLVARHLRLSGPGAEVAARRALHEAASWTGVGEVRVEAS